MGQFRVTPQHRLNPAALQRKWRPGAATGSASRSADASDWRESAGIPDGTVLDAGLTQYHSDGTEIINSERPPSGSFCLGVWENVGSSKYKLNHFPIVFNADGTFLGPAHLRENVTLSRDHNSFTGTFSLGQYDTDGNLLPPGLSTEQSKPSALL